MKKYILLFIILFSGNALLAGDADNAEKNAKIYLISGTVADELSGDGIAGAEIRIGNKVFYTDLDGKFSACIDTDKTEAIIKYISYEDARVTFEPFSDKQLEILLKAK